MGIERLLITVRTYPNLSKKHFETVCTGGINEQGQWRRLYPVPLRLLDEDKQYRTYDVVTVKLDAVSADGRPESRRPDNATFKVVKHLKSWESRRDWIVPTAVNSMQELCDSGRTLAPVAVREVLEFLAEPTTNEWSPAQQEMLRQTHLFEAPSPLEKIPYEFRLRWRDGASKEHDSLFLAWEVGQTWRKWRDQQYDNVIGRMRDKWMNEVFSSSRDLWFFMGNFAQHPQHFGACGVFNPPKEHHATGNLW